MKQSNREYEKFISHKIIVTFNFDEELAKQANSIWD